MESVHPQSPLPQSSSDAPIELPLLNYRERPLSRLERKLFKLLLRQRRERVPWWRLLLMMPLVTVVFGVEALFVGWVEGWTSPWEMLICGMYLGMLIYSIANYRVARRNWPVISSVIDWSQVERLVKHDSGV